MCSFDLLYINIIKFTSIWASSIVWKIDMIWTTFTQYTDWFHLIQSDELSGLGESCPDHVNLSYIVYLLMWSRKYGIYCYRNKITSIIPKYYLIWLKHKNSRQSFNFAPNDKKFGVHNRRSPRNKKYNIVIVKFWL